MVKATIFDIDGTLLDSVDLHAKAWQEAFRDFGHEVSFDEIRQQIGKGGDQLMPVFLSKDELERIGKKLEEHRSSLFKNKYLPRVRPFPKVRELFERLKHDGIALALGSPAKPDELTHYERIAEIEDLVEVETSSGEAEKSKPHPDIFEAALASLKSTTDRQKVVVVGDSPHDVEAAKRASLRTIGLLCGGFGEEVLRTAGVIALYKDPADLLEHYKSSPLAAS
jgi:HAD superfamily hydrolase (TIGR01509 family)